MNNVDCKKIIAMIQRREYLLAADYIKNATAADEDKKGTWKYHGRKIVAFLESVNQLGMVDENNVYLVKIPFTIFAKGNSKLPFYAFSVLPLITCSGMGACAKWCYSLKAWRYPAAFFRQIQNTVLVYEAKNRLAAEFTRLTMAKRNVNGFDFRLYVDGDFDSVDTLRFWMELLGKNPNVKAYGYSKSWQHFLTYRGNGFTFPPNYVLNLSGGSRYDNNPEMKAAMQSLSCTRGEFVALPSSFDSKKDFKNQRSELLGKVSGKRMVCTGKCGACVLIAGKNVHACGSKLFQDVKILIGIH